MKHLFSLSLSIFMLFGIFSCTAQDNKAQNGTKVSGKVEVYYFHYTRRCHTCETVEAESKKAVETLYPEQVKNGTITFQAVNLDEESSKKITEKIKVPGQSLLIIKAGKQVDLTDKAFMYATSTPEKLKAEIKKAIDNM